MTSAKLKESAIAYVRQVMPAKADLATERLQIRVTRIMPRKSYLSLAKRGHSGTPLGYCEHFARICKGKSVRRLYVYADQSDHQQMLTALHEVGHWLWDCYDITRPYESGGDYLRHYIAQPVLTTYALEDEEQTVEAAARKYVASRE